LFKKYKSGLIKHFESIALPHFATGNIKPIIHKTFPIENVHDAYAEMEKNLNIGKILLKITSSVESEEL
jgi:tumor protein p53-inducible protein 3